MTNRFSPPEAPPLVPSRHHSKADDEFTKFAISIAAARAGHTRPLFKSALAILAARKAPDFSPPPRGGRGHPLLRRRAPRNTPARRAPCYLRGIAINT